MSEIKLTREHDLGIDKARELARGWVDDAARKLGLKCHMEQGAEQDRITFERMGVHGTMLVSGTGFDLSVKLGMMMAALRPMVEAEIARNLDAVIAKARGAGAEGSA